MTLLLPAPFTPTPTIRWTFIDNELWVGNSAGAFAGTVDPQNGHFYARDKFGQYLGDYPTLKVAQTRLEAQAREAAA